MKKLPANWTTAGIEEALLPFGNGQTLRQGWSPQCERFAAETEDDWGVLKTTAIQDGEFQPEHNKRLPSALEPDPLLEVQEGDLLLTCAGPRVRCGVICLVRETRRRLMVSGKMYRFRTDPRIALATYLEAFLRSHDTKKRIDEMKTGISDSGLNLTLSRFKTLQVPLPPLPEQRRIVAKIEELFSELDEGIENLKRAREQLAVYRQALLKHAFEGKLTADWRAAHGKDSSSWSEVAVGDILIGKPTNGRSVPDRTGGFKVLRLTSIKNGYIDLTQNKEGAWSEAEAADQVLHRGDFLISRGNGSLHLVGKGGLVLSDDRVAYPDTMVRMNVNPSAYDQRLFCYFWNSASFRHQIESSARTTAGIYKINQALLMAYRFPLMPLAEQRVIVEILDSQIPALDSLESDIDANLQKAEALRQSILKKAFAGELVSQDPADEPAADLLARIRAERAAASSAKPVRTRGRPSASAPSA